MHVVLLQPMQGRMHGFPSCSACARRTGVAEGISLGTPICVMVPNTDQKSQDYTEMAVAYRPSHADATYDMKYGIRAVRTPQLRSRLGVASDAGTSACSGSALLLPRGFRHLSWQLRG